MVRRVFTWSGLIIGSLLVLLLLAAAGGYIVSDLKLKRVYTVTVRVPDIPTGSAAIARGRNLAIAAHCVGCHAPDLSGTVMLDAEPGRFVPPNLTRGVGGVGARYTDADWVRAIRHGLRPDGTPIMLMPAYNMQILSEADLGALIAYVKSMPAVDNQPGTSELRPLGRALMLAGQLPLPADRIDHQAGFQPAPPIGRSAAYGRYLAVLGNCADCHGAKLAGQQTIEPGAPPAANLTPDGALKAWSEEDFIRAMRTGVRPNGAKINPAMPWELTGQLSDDDLGAIYRYLKSLPAQPYGNN